MNCGVANLLKRLMDTPGKVRPPFRSARSKFRAGVAVVVVSVLVLITQVGALTAEASGMMFFASTVIGPDKWLHQSDSNKKWNQFGKAVAVYGDDVIIGALGDDNVFDADGSAYVYNSSGGTWPQFQKLQAAIPEACAQFGSSVDIDQNTIVIGAFARGGGCGGSGNYGAAYVFERISGVWTEVKVIQEILPVWARLGDRVAVSGDLIAVTALGTGTVYIYGRNQGGAGTWGKITSRSGGGQFGIDIDLQGDLLVVGANTAGRAYVYDQAQGWGKVGTLVPTDAADPWFGYTVGVSGDTAVVGALHASKGGITVAGAAYVYQKDQGGAGAWGFVKKLTAGNAGVNDQAGRSVAISGDLIAMGAFAANPWGADSGGAYVFSRDDGGTDNWGEIHNLIADATGGINHWFGDVIDIHSGRVVVGAPMYAVEVSPSKLPGYAYIYDIEVVAAAAPPPTTAPSAATGLTAWPSASGVMDVNWIDGSTDEAGFKLQRRVDGSPSWTTIDWPAAGVTSFSDGGLNPATSYCYRIRSYNAAGSSGYVDSLPQCTPASLATVAPAATSAFTATAASSTRVDLQWTDNSLIERGHKLQRRASGSASWTTIAWPGVGVTSHADTGLTPGTYCYRMRAYNLVGSSPYVHSAPVCVSTGGVPATPTFVMVNSATATQVNINWNDNANNELGVKVQRRPIGSSSWTTIKWVAADSTGYSDAGLATGAYCYRIRAFNSSGSSPYVGSFPLCVSVGGVPAAPMGVSATGISSSRIDLSWTDNSSNELGFKVQRQPQGGSGWTTVKWAAPGATSFSNTGLASGTYCYRIRSFNSSGSSEYVSSSCAATN